MQDARFSEVTVVLDQELHDLAQPIASFQCRLEIGLILGGEDALKEAATGGLEDLRCIISALSRMRRVVESLKTESAA